MKDDVRALAYLAWRQIVNAVREAMKKPGRVALWVIIAIGLAAGIAARIAEANIAAYARSVGGHVRGLGGGLGEPWSTAIFFGYAIALAMVIGVAAGGNVPGFSSEADARFLTLSHISPRRMLAWLQLRGSASMLLQVGYLSLFYSIFFAQLGSPLPIFLTMVGAALFAAATRMPVLRACLRFGAAPFKTLAVCLGALGICGLAIVLGPYVAPALAKASAYVVGLGLGSLLRSMFLGAPLPILILWLGALGTLASGFLGKTDVVPEIYAASLRALVTAVRNKRGLRFGSPQEDGYEAVTPTRTTRVSSQIWRGALALVWKDWIAFSRSRGAIGRSLLLLAGGLAAGAVLGLWINRGHDPNIVIIQAVNLAVIFLSLSSSVTLNADLGKPLWWLNADTLVARLGAWVAAATWREAALGASAAIGCAAVLRSLPFALLGSLAACGIVLYMRCIGLALYAIFPSQIDQKGAAAGLRVLLAYAFIAPAGIAAGIAGAAASSFVVAGFAGAIVAAIECFYLIGFAADRIRDNGVGIARAEAT